MPELLANPETWIALITLIALEIVLGIDNIVFISILVGNLPPQERERARRLGIGLALIMRLCLLFVWSTCGCCSTFACAKKELGGGS